MKKKLMALVLAMGMVFGMSTTAFAEDVKYDASDATTFTIEKAYTSEEDFVPGETLSFTIGADDNNPDDSKLISIGENNQYKVSTDTKNQAITVNVPSYNKAGIYNYTIVEQKGTTAGVTYDTTKTIYVTVLVEYDNENKKLVIGNEAVDGIVYFIKEMNGVKTDEFSNKFNTNDFTIEKDVQGNMANENDKFEVTVTMTSTKDILTSITVAGQTVTADNWTKTEGTYTYTTQLRISESGGAVTIADVPYGVRVKVEETNAGDYTLLGYVVNNGEKSTNVPIFEIDSTDNAVVVVNEKTSEVDTGIFVDSIPYIVMLALVCGAAVLFVANKKRSINY